MVVELSAWSQFTEPRDVYCKAFRKLGWIRWQKTFEDCFDYGCDDVNSSSLVVSSSCHIWWTCIWCLQQNSSRLIRDSCDKCTAWCIIYLRSNTRLSNCSPVSELWLISSWSIKLARMRLEFRISSDMSSSKNFGSTGIDNIIPCLTFGDRRVLDNFVRLDLWKTFWMGKDQTLKIFWSLLSWHL